MNNDNKNRQWVQLELFPDFRDMLETESATNKITS